MIKKLKILAILPFLAIMTSVKAYDFNGISKISRVDMGLYYDSTQLYQVSCTSSNDGYCGLEDSDLPNASNTYNNLRFVLRGNLNKTFTVGTQYKISWYFYQYTAGYFIRGADITQVTGNTYRDFTNWTSDSITILTYNLSLIESDSNKGLYRMDITFIPSTTNVAGFNFRLYSDYETISNDNGSYLEGTRYLQIVQLSADSPDYTQDLNNINQNISDLSDNISDSTQDIIDNQNQNAQDIQDTINNNFQDCHLSVNLANVTSTSNYLSYSNETLTLTYGTGATGSSFAYLTPFLLKSGKTYTMSIFLVGSNSNTKPLEFVLRGDSIVLDISRNTSSDIIYSFTPSSDITIDRLQLYNSTFNTTTGSVSFHLQVQEGSGTAFEPYGEQICKNKLDNLNDSLTDETPPDLSALQNSAGWLPPGPVDSILNLPLALFNNLNTNLSKTCQPVTVALPLVSSNISLPCISTVYAQMPNLANFLNWIGYLAAGIILYKYFLHLYKWVDNTLTFRENNWLDNWGGD